MGFKGMVRAMMPTWKAITKTNKIMPDEEGKYKIHIGPGAKWKKPAMEWVSLDVDPKRADVVINFSNFGQLPFEDGSIKCIYGSHIFEHIDVYVSPRFFKECHRVLTNNGVFRLILPDVRKSIEEYLKGNVDFPLFSRRRRRVKELCGIDYTIFECLREDFLSKTGQPGLLGSKALAHQNAWDWETIVEDLVRAGFKRSNVHRMDFKKTMYADFAFEGTYPAEANEQDRSMYVEVVK